MYVPMEWLVVGIYIEQLWARMRMFGTTDIAGHRIKRISKYILSRIVWYDNNFKQLVIKLIQHNQLDYIINKLNHD